MLVVIEYRYSSVFLGFGLVKLGILAYYLRLLSVAARSVLKRTKQPKGIIVSF